MKKVLSLFLSFLMLLSVCVGIDFSACAGQELDTIINPLYDGIIDENAFYSKGGSSSYAVTAPQVKGRALSINSASKALRDAMVDRLSTTTINVVSSYINPSNTVSVMLDNATSQEFSQSTVDGDYLKWNWYSIQPQVLNATLTSGGYNYLIRFDMEFLSTASQEKQITDKVNQTIKKLDLNAKSQYTKLKLIHDFVCDTVRYDYVHVNDDTYKRQFSTYGALISGYAVCQGYATLFYRLCMEVGISSRVIAGENHAWNIAKIDDVYYYVDTTFDDTSLDFYPEKDSVKGYWADKYVYDWFLKGSDYYTEKKHPTQMSDYNKPAFKKEYPISADSFACLHPTAHWSIPDDADCTVGYDKYLACDICDEFVERDYVSPVAEHKYTKKVVSPTCTAGGYTEYICSLCNSHYRENETSPLGHKYKNYVTKATMSANGSIVNKCSVCGAKKSTSTIYKVSSVALSTYSCYYTGTTRTPSVTVKDSKGKTLKNGTDYTVTYPSGRINVGRYAVKITLKGNYSGSKTLYYNIMPKGVSKITKVTAKSKGFTVSWATQKTQTTGYQIQYSTSSKFSNAKTITMPKNTYSAKSISGLTGNKKYYVRIRTYKVTKFGGKNYNIYSPWSSAKSVTTKR